MPSRGWPSSASTSARELVDRAADRAAGARRVLDQQPRVAVAALRGSLQRGHDPLSPASSPAPRCEPTWKIDAVRLDRARDVDRRAHRLRPTCRRSRRSARRGCRGRARGRRRRRCPPRPGAALKRSIASGVCAVGRHMRGLCVKTWTHVGADRLGPVDRRVDPAGGRDVGAEQHRVRRAGDGCLRTASGTSARSRAPGRRRCARARSARPGRAARNRRARPRRSAPLGHTSVCARLYEAAPTRMPAR